MQKKLGISLKLKLAKKPQALTQALGQRMQATDEEKLKPLYDALVKSAPKIVILDPEYHSRRSRHMNALITPFLQNQNYRKVTEQIYIRQ